MKVQPSKGFVGTLFDLSFREFITPRWTRLFFTAFLIYAAVPLLLGVVLDIVLVRAYGTYGLLASIGVETVLVSWYVIEIIVARLVLEAVVVVFRIEERTRPGGSLFGQAVDLS